MRLYLIRHGQSANNAFFTANGAAHRTADTQGYPGRVPDPALTPQGHQQAAALAEAIRAGRTLLPLTHLYSSLTLRAVQTATYLADALDLPVRLRADLYEVGGVHRFDTATGTRHAMAGHSIRQLKVGCPRAVATADSDQDLPWHGGFETEDDALPRARRLLTDLRRIHGGSTDAVGLVTHQHFGQFLLADVLGISGPPWRRFRIDNTAHVAIDFTRPDPEVHWVNRSDHLSPREVSN
jgi:2,3-bisphosphoglycerate-dependent phosphoglycerate mutase